MRVGKNPAKTMSTVPDKARITIATVVYIPMLSGFYKESLDVLKLCLGSIFKNTTIEYDLMVFDNGSCKVVRDYLVGLRDQNKIQYLILSEKNIGTSGAWNHMFAVAPGEFIAYTDSDVYHYDGWLTASMNAMKLFPEAGMITGMPLKTHPRFNTATVSWAEENNLIKKNVVFPWEIYWRHFKYLNRTKEEAKKYYDENPTHQIIKNNKHFYIGAGHFQFVVRKEVVQKLLPLPADSPMRRARYLDIGINELGYLRLSLDKWYVQHMGNTVPDKGVLFEDDLLSGDWNQASEKKKKSSFWQNKFVRKILQWVYDRSFAILYRN